MVGPATWRNAPQSCQKTHLGVQILAGHCGHNQPDWGVWISHLVATQDAFSTPQAPMHPPLRPYCFFLLHPLQGPPLATGDSNDPILRHRWPRDFFGVLPLGWLTHPEARLEHGFDLSRPPAWQYFFWWCGHYPESGTKVQGCIAGLLHHLDTPMHHTWVHWIVGITCL